MKKFDNHDLFKEMYYHELERRDAINGRIGIPLGVLPLLIGAGLYIYDNKDNVDFGSWNWAFNSALIVYCLLLLLASYNLSRAYIGYKYGYFPLASDLEKYKDNVFSFYEDEDEETQNELVSIKIRIFLTKLYKENTDRNMIQNERKLQFLWRSGLFIISSLLVGAAIGSFYFLGQKEELKKPIKVQIVNIQSNDSKQGGEQTMGDKDQQNPPKNSKKTEPEEPKARILNENFNKIPENIQKKRENSN